MASAFHALIRLAYAIDGRQEAEMMVGLALWVIQYQTLGALGGPTHSTPMEIAESGRAAFVAR